VHRLQGSGFIECASGALVPESVIPESVGVGVGVESTHDCAAAHEEAAVTQRRASSDSDAQPAAHCGETAPQRAPMAEQTCSQVGASTAPIGAAQPISKLHTATSQSDRMRISSARTHSVRVRAATVAAPPFSLRRIGHRTVHRSDAWLGRARV
jgi:hypothetical protein